MFQDEWLRTYQPSTILFDRTIIALDTAFKAGASNDYSAAVVIGALDAPDGHHAAGYYILRSWHGRLPFGELKRFVVELAKEFGDPEIIVEDAASGQSLIQELQYETALLVKPVKVDADKVSRASAVASMFESGKVFLPEKGCEALVDELLSFPIGSHDDLVDSVVHGLNYLRSSTLSHNRARQWAESLREPKKPTISTSPSLRAYERAAMRGSCTVCHKAIHGAKLVQQPDGTSITRNA